MLMWLKDNPESFYRFSMKYRISEMILYHAYITSLVW